MSDKRKKILNAAEILLAERGFYGLSMKALADSAGVAAGTIYRYFENKEDMINQLHQHVKEEIAAVSFKGLHKGLSEKEKYALCWRNTYQSVLTNPNRLIAVSMLFLRPCVKGQEMLSCNDALFAPLFNIYEQGIREHIFHDFPVQALISLSFESSINLAKKVMNHSIDQPDEQLITQIIDASWQAILKPTT
ncbi:transcriptional regulator, TetR family [Psychromonas ingrahamii 37]|uniref:Transcriptional regulator, TetR family n=1 Tax=Psychromonas ingrahamii (strain DSM 17664 / CCUG 51855 / 37) TaxID=357804 RepID=A1T092_PSYIN|nr:TetR/AcrR family transcriptional regulator [Psychromonas ingrahamii]ABM05157.1 transcriptional regulator, TetR family [Psychromonas ingrahamii 37]